MAATARITRVLAMPAASLLLVSCAVEWLGSRVPGPTTTFEKVLPLARAGDAEFQNLLGFMHYFGEGVDQDLVAAERWFKMSAANGHPAGQLNHDVARQKLLALTDRSRMGQVTAPASRAGGETQARQWRAGEETYSMFCAGCHGLNGVASFSKSPSFALSQRMEKTDDQLFRSVRDGIGEMPAWGGKISDAELRNTIAFVRTLRRSYLRGITQDLRDAPQTYFLFGPMMGNHSAFHGR